MIAGAAPLPFPTACSPQAWSAAAPVLLLRAVLGLEIDLPRASLHLNPCVPDDWMPLTLHQIPSGRCGSRCARAVDGTTVTGLPDDVRILHGPWFTG